MLRGKIQNIFAVYHLLHHIYFNEDRKRANLCRTRQHALWREVLGKWRDIYIILF